MSKLILSALWVVPILGFAVLTAPADAHASGEEGSDTGLISVCEGNDLVTTDSEGASLSSEELQLALREVRSLCDEESEERPDAAGPDGSAARAAVGSVTMSISQSGAVMSIKSWANSWYYNYSSGTPENRLSCIYRRYGSGSWQSCGAVGMTTYGSTATLQSCPLPGLQYEGYASVYVNGTRKARDYDLHTVL